ncbi:MAG TPA: glycosyltransferase family 4 protein [Bryobacteraceae bacterium]|nr:glycosyltransferase family 4 protein [Bryobacteraceae bacterium]
MRVLLLHNRYRHLGGEDAVVAAERDLLRAEGVEVFEHGADNGAPGQDGWRGTLRRGLASAWSAASYASIRALCDKVRPDVVHVHNFWMSLTPSVHAAAQDFGAATVQSLHNFRLLCVNATFLRNGTACEDCLGHGPWRGVARRCYRDSAVASAAVAQMIVSNRRRDTWGRHVNAFIALSEHSRSKFVEGGLPAERLFVKPNFMEDPGPPDSAPSESHTILFAGRLSEEKGLAQLLQAWADYRLGEVGRLVIAGDGPLRADLIGLASRLSLTAPQVQFPGRIAPAEVNERARTARALVLPSLCYENFPRGVLDAFANARPLVATNIGALGELVAHGENGLTFPAGDTAALGGALGLLLRDEALADRLGRQARAEYLSRYTPELNVRSLLEIYSFARAHRDRRERQSVQVRAAAH